MYINNRDLVEWQAERWYMLRNPYVTLSRAKSGMQRMSSWARPSNYTIHVWRVIEQLHVWLNSYACDLTATRVIKQLEIARVIKKLARVIKRRFHLLNFIGLLAA